MFKCSKDLQRLPDTWHSSENLWVLFHSDIINSELLTWCLRLITHKHRHCHHLWGLSCCSFMSCSHVLVLVGHLRCCRFYWLHAWLENRFDLRDPGLLSHLVREEDQIYGDKIPISWTGAKCESCWLSSKSQTCLLSYWFVSVNRKSHQCSQTEKAIIFNIPLM